MDLDNLEDGKQARVQIKRLHKLGQSASNPEASSVFGFAIRLIFFSTIGRTVWQYMTDEQHQTEIKNAEATLRNQDHAKLAAPIIEYSAAHLKNVPARLRIRRIEGVDASTFGDANVEAKERVDRSMDVLGTLLCSGVTFLDCPEEGTYAMQVLGDVISTIEADDIDIEFAIKVELLTMAKILWPKYDFVATRRTIEDFMDDLDEQLESDGLLEPTDEWVKSATWPDDTSKLRAFSRAFISPQSHTVDNSTGTATSLKGLETEAVRANGRQISTPIVERNITIKQVLPHATEYRSTFNDVDEAIDHLTRPRRQVDPREPDDDDTVRAQFTRYRKRIYNAIITQPSDMDEWQQDEWQVFINMVAMGQLEFMDIEANAWVITEEILKLHQHGVTLDPRWDLGLPSAIDNEMRCSERMETVIASLLYNKTLCAEIIWSHHSLLRFVTAPTMMIEYGKRDRPAQPPTRFKNDQLTRMGIGALRADRTAVAPLPRPQLRRISKRLPSRDYQTSPSPPRQARMSRRDRHSLLSSPYNNTGYSGEAARDLQLRQTPQAYKRPLDLTNSPRASTFGAPRSAPGRGHESLHPRSPTARGPPPPKRVRLGGDEKEPIEID